MMAFRIILIRLMLFQPPILHSSASSHDKLMIVLFSITLFDTTSALTLLIAPGLCFYWLIHEPDFGWFMLWIPA